MELVEDPRAVGKAGQFACGISVTFKMKIL